MSSQVMISESGLELRASVFSSNGKQIKLYSMMHVGSETFFKIIYDSCKASEIVILEGKEFSETPSSTDKYIYDANFINGKILKLYFEVMPIFLHMSKQRTLYELIKENLNFEYVDVDGSKEGFLKTYEKAISSSINLLDEMVESSSSNNYKEIYRKYFDFYSNVALGLEKSVNKDEKARNEHIVDTVIKISESYSDISMLYGVGHSFYFENFFLNKGFQLSKIEWLVAMSAPNQRI